MKIETYPHCFQNFVKNYAEKANLSPSTPLEKRLFNLQQKHIKSDNISPLEINGVIYALYKTNAGKNGQIYVGQTKRTALHRFLQEVNLVYSNNSMSPLSKFIKKSRRDNIVFLFYKKSITKNNCPISNENGFISDKHMF